MKRFFLILLMLGFFAPFLAAHAVVVPNLNVVKVSVQNKTTVARFNAIKQGIKEVLVRLSGDEDIASEAILVPEINRADQYVSQYNYLVESKEGVEHAYLSMAFDRIALKQLLIRSHLPIWSEDRPIILVWFLVQDQKGSHIITNSDNPYLTVLQKASNARGVPLIFPMMDLQDRKTISVNDVWAPFEMPIKNASKRYNPDEILVVRFVTAHTPYLSSHWTLFLQDQTLRWDESGNLPEDLIQKGFSDVANALAERFSLVENNQTVYQLKLLVTQMKGINDYGKVLRYLKRLSGVQSVNVSQVTSNSATFGLDISTDITTFQKTLRLGEVISPLYSGEVSSNIKGPLLLMYRMR